MISGEDTKNPGSQKDSDTGDPASISQPVEPESALPVASNGKKETVLEKTPTAASNGQGKPEAVQRKPPLPDIYSVQSTPPIPPERSISRWLSSYSAALMLTGSVVPVPFVALVFTAAIYILPPTSPFDKLSALLSLLPNPAMDIIYGLVITIVFWLVASILFLNATTRVSVNAYSSNHINSHLLSLKALFSSIQETQKTGSNPQGVGGGNVDSIVTLRDNAAPYYDTSYEKAQKCISSAEQELQKGGATWLDGSGYLNVWMYIHRAEEAMMIIAPVEEVVKEAVHDDASIDGSALPTRDDVLNRLRLAIRKLSPAAGIYVKPPAIEPIAFGGNSNSSDTRDTQIEMNARIAIRDVKLTLNEFRDSLWDGMVRVRNMLVAVALITGALSFVLLSAVLLLGATISGIQAALIFYLVGAFTGMFGRLITESQSDTAVDDYGLTVARVVVTPLIAGLAALAGVFLLAILSVNLLQTPAAPSPSKIPTLDEIYNIAKNPQGLLSAAIFGLTPNLFISILKQQADVVTTKLKNSSASNQGGT